MAKPKAALKSQIRVRGVGDRSLTSLLMGVDIPILVLDPGLCIRWFNPIAGTLPGG